MKLKKILKEILICPFCKKKSLLNTSKKYYCRICKRGFPIIDNIPRFLDEYTISTGQKAVKRSFGFLHSNYKLSRYLQPSKQLVRDWLNIVKLPPEYFKGKLVLDAGCGAGRWTYALASLGAKVIAIDIARGSVESTKKITKKFPNVQVIQASVFNLPFQKKSFDFVVSWGILHHTPNTKKAFNNLPPLVKIKGGLHIMVYEKYQPIRQFFTNVLRFFLQKLSEEKLYNFCRFLIFRNKFVHSILSSFIICSYYNPSQKLDISTLQFGLFDAYSPRYNWLHTTEEVKKWFEEFKFKDIKITSPLISYKALGFIPLRHYESINMRGHLK